MNCGATVSVAHCRGCRRPGNLSSRTEVENQKLKKSRTITGLLSNIGKWTSERGDEALTGEEEGRVGMGALLGSKTVDNDIQSC